MSYEGSCLIFEGRYTNIDISLGCLARNYRIIHGSIADRKGVITSAKIQESGGEHSLNPC